MFPQQLIKYEDTNIFQVEDNKIRHRNDKIFKQKQRVQSKPISRKLGKTEIFCLATQR